jgi:hypothetical protein
MAAFTFAGQRQSASQPKDQVFQTSWSTIPATYKGDDIVALIQALSVERGSFESTVEYNDRLEYIAVQKEKYAFFADPDLEELYNFEVKYNPDKRCYDIVIFSDWRTSLLLRQIEKERDATEKQSAFGTKKPLLDSIVNNYSIHLMNESMHGPIGMEKVLFEGTIKVSPEDAPKYKNRIKIILLARIVPSAKIEGDSPIDVLSENPYYSRSYQQTDVVLPRPINATEYTHYLNVNLDTIYFYDSLDRRIIGRFSMAEDDFNAKQARMAIQDRDFIIAAEYISKLPYYSAAAQELRKSIETERQASSVNTPHRIRDIEEDFKNFGPEPTKSMVNKLLHEVIPTKFSKPVEILTVTKPVKALTAINREFYATWQVKAEIKSPGQPRTRILYLYIKNDTVFGSELF